ncbi:MAG: HAD family hydrolase [Caldiserica bacterium]|nr:HAD family hydrolase [Caldisericota bacterium]
MIRAISLDLWKTLILDHDEDEALRDRVRARAIREVLGEHGVAVSEDGLYESLRRIDVLRRDIREMRDWTLTTSNQIAFVLTQASVYPSREVVDAVLPQYEAAIFQLMPSLVESDAPQLLTDLAQHYPLSLTSNTGKTSGHVLLNVLDTLNIRMPFTHFIFSDEVLYLKPDKGIWQLLVVTNELKPEEIVHVGDSYRMDYQGARTAGLQAILFGRQESLPTETLAIDSLSELSTMIEEMNR